MNNAVSSENVELEKRLASFEKDCRERGLRITEQRREIFRTVVASKEHPSAEMVYSAVRKQLPNVSLDTVYRTLASLEQMSFLIRLGNSSKERFDGDLRPHAHFICQECGEVYDVFPTEAENLLLPELAQEWGEIKQVTLQFRGICTRCKRKAGK